MLSSIDLPAGLELVRTTPAFTPESVPNGLLSAHRIAPGVWGLLRVLYGAVVFTLESTGEQRRLLAGDTQVIEPEVLHRVDPGAGSVFAVEFHR